MRNLALMSRIEQQQEEEIEAAAAAQAPGRTTHAGRQRSPPRSGAAWQRQQNQAMGPAPCRGGGYAPMDWQHEPHGAGAGRSRAVQGIEMQAQAQARHGGPGWGHSPDHMGPPAGRGLPQHMGGPAGQSAMHRRPSAMGQYDLSDLDFGALPQPQRWQQQLDGPAAAAQGAWQRRSHSGGEQPDAWDTGAYGGGGGAPAALAHGLAGDGPPRALPPGRPYARRGPAQHQGQLRSAGAAYPEFGQQGPADGLLHHQLMHHLASDHLASDHLASDHLASDHLLDTLLHDWPQAAPGAGPAGRRHDPHPQEEEGFGVQSNSGAAGVQWQHYRRGDSAQRRTAAGMGYAAAHVAAAAPGQQLKRAGLSDSWEQLLGPGPELGLGQQLGQQRRPASRQQLAAAMDYGFEQQGHSTQWGVGQGLPASTQQQHQQQQQQQQQRRQWLQDSAAAMLLDTHDIKHEPAPLAMGRPDPLGAAPKLRSTGGFGLPEQAVAGAAPSRAQYTATWPFGDQ
jgi:hypothetical protein